MILLKDHSWVHANKKFFQCPLLECNKTFRQPHSGLSHLRIVHGMRVNALARAFETSVFKLDVWRVGEQKVPAKWLKKYQEEEGCDLAELRREYCGMVEKEQVKTNHLIHKRGVSKNVLANQKI